MQNKSTGSHICSILYIFKVSKTSKFKSTEYITDKVELGYAQHNLPYTLLPLKKYYRPLFLSSIRVNLTLRSKFYVKLLQRW